VSPREISQQWVERLLGYDNFSIFQDCGRRHHGFSKGENFRGGKGQEAKMPDRAKFCGDPSNSWSDMAIFNFSRWRPETGFPSSHQLKSYVASKSRLKLAARCPVSGCWQSCILSLSPWLLTYVSASSAIFPGPKQSFP